MAVSVRRIRAEEALPLREIRMAALGDAPQAFTTTLADVRDQPMAFWADRARTNASGHDMATFVAEDVGGAWVGMVACYHPVPGDPEAELVAMWVAPEARGGGAAAALVGTVLDWAAEIGAPRVGLWVVRGNQPAIRLYERCGFVEVPEFTARPGDPCGNEMRMRHELAS